MSITVTTSLKNFVSNSKYKTSFVAIMKLCTLKYFYQDFFLHGIRLGKIFSPFKKFPKIFPSPILVHNHFFHPFLNFWAHFPCSSPCKIVYLKNLKNRSRKGYGKCIEQKYYHPHKIFEFFPQAKFGHLLDMYVTERYL